MNIALVTETFPPEVNGVAMTLSRLVGGMRARGHTVDVVRPRQKVEVAAGVTDAGELDYVVPGVPIPFYSALRMGLPVTGQLKKRWRERRPDVVHVATEGPLGLAALRAAHLLKLPVTSSFHTNFHQYGGHYGLTLGRDLALRYLRWFHNRTRCTMVPASDLRAQLASDGFERLVVLARGVDAKLFSPAKRNDALRAEWGAAADDPVMIYVGRIAAEKNLSLAVEAFLALQAKLPRAKFVLVGDGPEKASLAKQYPQFHYAGMRRGEELAAHYASADVFAFASVTETFGNVVTEAMASGLVVLAYDYAATREHVRDGINGFAAAFAKREAFLAGMDLLLARRGDWPPIRLAARKTAEDITWDAIFDVFERELGAAATRSL
ncbi:glycosyltransferase family 4 protein [Rariglobus hedericola]|uniref:Glycosyltransferase family 1 protein n=1 Tax=Rariglobus hedericola TaxID=2597822 RepID=A0A556QEP4_9BACT|nr:glycosyltransferase family 1 protein [Rariglobus hedericola]TSJ75119.1 glycosyltransferase family 1 protein [Rariglobus hedericola]